METIYEYTISARTADYQIKAIEVEETEKMYKMPKGGGSFQYNYRSSIKKSEFDNVLKGCWAVKHVMYSHSDDAGRFFLAQVLEKENKKLESLKVSVQKQEERCQKIAALRPPTLRH